MRRAAAALVAVWIVVALLVPTPRAQPADVNRAKDLYVSAEAAMADGRYNDALRDYGAAYELTKDPVLFFKIGGANEKAGKCETAIVYFRRYLREAHPAENFVTLTKQRIVVCGGDANDTAPVDTGSGSGSGSAGSGSSAGSAGST